MTMSRLLSIFGLGALLLGSACGGSTTSGDRVASANWTMKINPGQATLAPGQSFQFAASTPWGNQTLWSVLPASAGTLTPAGRFTAAGTPGTCTVYAMWAQDVRYVASVPVTILPPPPPIVSSPNLVQGFGSHQQVAGTGISHGAVGGETVTATTATGTADPSVSLRHGFEPPK